MPCFSPRLIINRKYVKMYGSALRAEECCHTTFSIGTREVRFTPPDFYIPVRCGRCLDCQRYRSTMWRTRLLDEYNFFSEADPDNRNKVFFVTLTIAPKYYDVFKADPSYMIRLFLERYRKVYGRSFKHWICSEYGERRGRLHFHGIFFNPLCSHYELSKLWQYGWVTSSVLRSDRGIKYASKYITKYIDTNFISWDKRSKVWCSPGIGRAYAMSSESRAWHHQGSSPKLFRVDDTGCYALGMPRYYRNLLFSPPELDRQRADYFSSQNLLPAPPYLVGRRQFGDLSSYFRELHRIGGTPVLNYKQFDLLNTEQIISYFYGK